MLVSVVILLHRYDDALRYRHLPCQYGLLNSATRQANPIDYAFFGSSRSFEAINATIMADAIGRNQKISHQPIVYDLSKSWRGGGISYIMVRDFLSRNKVKNIVVEANFTNKLIYHNYWYSVATYADLIADIKTRRDISLLEKLSIFISHASRKFSGDIVALIQAKVPTSGGTESIDKFDCSSANGKERPDQRENARLRHKVWQDRQITWDLASDFEARNDYYYEMLSELAAEYGVNLYFAYYNSSYSPRLSEEFVSSFEQRYEHSLIHIDDANFLADVYETGFRDINHMKETGQQKYAEWFSDNVVGRFQ